MAFNSDFEERSAAITTSSTQTADGRRIKRGWMNLKVARVVPETHDTLTFVLVDADEGGRPFDYIAGQYLTFRFDKVTDKPVVRSYTMSSSPCEKDYAAFTVKRVEGGLISNWLCDSVKEGDVLRARGPIGKFVYDPTLDREHLFMIGAGSGATPFVSIAREHAPFIGKPGHPKHMTFLVSYRSTDDLICWTTLQEATKHAGVRIITTLSRENLPNEGFWHGRIDEAMIARALGNEAGRTTFMLCGPIPMMHLGESYLLGQGVPREHVKTESFASS